MSLKPTPQWVPKHPGSTSEAISTRMSVARRRDTVPELALRRVLHARGLRFRVNYPIPGQGRRTIDIAFTRPRVAVFVDGCFWHGCPEHGTRPQKNSAWWQAKLAANRARDADSDAVLRDLGWSVLRVWEHEPPELAAARIAEHVAAASLRSADD
jgi:DNA mismatch endonuclease (patch repair protein)